ncbi:unnamed protein product [Vitrella brassicaformis CCMP3155]|uniref:Uncharacterized protein n=2 Tax=Vitrella brassicaformis TaxID=1169539 RepID=A0A0G4FG56_VITBC|nr:unnamed protein product [Vitrella brassicaformis CCMP3155]|eukprot:CEM12144.1 unnamed protein product [Vitrella brassicaformis CCMP3155]
MDSAPAEAAHASGPLGWLGRQAFLQQDHHTDDDDGADTKETTSPDTQSGHPLIAAAVTAAEPPDHEDKRHDPAAAAVAVADPSESPHLPISPQHADDRVLLLFVSPSQDVSRSPNGQGLSPVGEREGRSPSDALTVYDGSRQPTEKAGQEAVSREEGPSPLTLLAAIVALCRRYWALFTAKVSPVHGATADDVDTDNVTTLERFLEDLHGLIEPTRDGGQPKGMLLSRDVREEPPIGDLIAGIEALARLSGRSAEPSTISQVILLLYDLAFSLPPSQVPTLLDIIKHLHSILADAKQTGRPQQQQQQQQQRRPPRPQTRIQPFFPSPVPASRQQPPTFRQKWPDGIGNGDIWQAVASAREGLMYHMRLCDELTQENRELKAKLRQLTRCRDPFHYDTPIHGMLEEFLREEGHSLLAPPPQAPQAAAAAAAQAARPDFLYDVSPFDTRHHQDRAAKPAPPSSSRPVSSQPPYESLPSLPSLDTNHEKMDKRTGVLAMTSQTIMDKGRRPGGRNVVRGQHASNGGRGGRARRTLSQ